VCAPEENYLTLLHQVYQKRSSNVSRRLGKAEWPLSKKRGLGRRDGVFWGGLGGKNNKFSESAYKSGYIGEVLGKKRWGIECFSNVTI